jgi:hypothetical protein
MQSKTGELSERQAARIIEMYENAMRNGEEWAHDVFLHRGTEKYAQSISTLNEAFAIKSLQTVIQALDAPEKPSPRPTRSRPPVKRRQK